MLYLTPPRHISTLPVHDIRTMGFNVRKDNAIGVQFYKKMGCAMFDMGLSWGCRWSRDEIIDLARKA